MNKLELIDTLRFFVCQEKGQEFGFVVFNALSKLTFQESLRSMPFQTFPLGLQLNASRFEAM
jgi:hypothetical protein